MFLLMSMLWIECPSSYCLHSLISLDYVPWYVSHHCPSIYWPQVSTREVKPKLKGEAETGFCLEISGMLKKSTAHTLSFNVPFPRNITDFRHTRQLVQMCVHDTVNRVFGCGYGGKCACLHVVVDVTCVNTRFSPSFF